MGNSGSKEGNRELKGKREREEGGRGKQGGQKKVRETGETEEGRIRKKRSGNEKRIRLRSNREPVIWQFSARGVSMKRPI